MSIFFYFMLYLNSINYFIFMSKPKKKNDKKDEDQNKLSEFE